MFEKIRKPIRPKNIASYVIFGTICLVFIFIGVPVNQIGSLGGAALLVNNKLVSWFDYQNYLEVLESQARESGGEIEATRQIKLRRQAMDFLIHAELMIQATDKNGILVSNQAIRDNIFTISIFQEDGRFVRSRYRSFLKSRRFSASHFENLIKKEIETSRLQNLFSKVIHMSRLETENNSQLKSFKVQVSYLRFPLKYFTKSEEEESFKQLIREGNQNQLNKILKNKQLNWKKTRMFDLSSSSLPGLESHKRLFDEVIFQLPQKGLVKKVIQLGDENFVLKVDDFYKEATLSEGFDADIDVFMSRILSRTVFVSWIESEREKATIQISSKLQSSLAP